MAKNDTEFCAAKVRGLANVQLNAGLECLVASATPKAPDNKPKIQVQCTGKPPNLECKEVPQLPATLPLDPRIIRPQLPLPQPASQESTRTR